MENRATLLMLFYFLCCFFSTNLVPSALAIWLSLPSSGTKCVSEEIHNNVVVLADYIVIPNDHSQSPTIALKVPFFYDPFHFSFVGPSSISDHFVFLFIILPDFLSVVVFCFVLFLRKLRWKCIEFLNLHVVCLL